MTAQDASSTSSGEGNETCREHAEKAEKPAADSSSCTGDMLEGSESATSSAVDTLLMAADRSSSHSVTGGIDNSAQGSNILAIVDDNSGQNWCDDQQMNSNASGDDDAAAVCIDVATADAITAGSCKAGAGSSPPSLALPKHDSGMAATPNNDVDDDVSSASRCCNERRVDKIDSHGSNHSQLRGGYHGAEADAHLCESRAQPNSTTNPPIDCFSRLSDGRADSVDVVPSSRCAQLPHLRNPTGATSSKDGRSLALSVGQEPGDRGRCEGDADVDSAAAEKLVPEADDFEFYAAKKQTAASSRGSSSGAGVSTSCVRMATETIGRVGCRNSPAATLSSPSEDFYSIYSGNGDYAVAAASATEISSVPPTLPPVYLPNSDAWVEVLGPASTSFPLQSLCVNHRTVWCVDRCDRLCYAVLGEPGIQWIALEQPAQLIACSPVGHIVWRLYRGSAYAAAGRIAKRTPAGSEWREVARDVAYLAVDDHVVWYVKSSGDVMMQKDLTRERTSYRSIKVPCDDHIVMIACRGNVVWAVNERHNVLVRMGIQKGLEEGTEWHRLEGFGANLTVSCVEIDTDRQVVWIVDMSHRVWFTTEVTSNRPQGSGLWFQISATGFIGISLSRKTAVKSLMELPLKLVSGNSTPATSGIISASEDGVWVFLSSQTVLNVCRSSITDTIWLQQLNGSIFCFMPSTEVDNQQNNERVSEVPPPAEIAETIVSIAMAFTTMCAASDALWGLLPDGRLFVRAGMSAHCSTGVEWVQVNLPNIDKKVKLVDIALGLHGVWAVDSVGCIHFSSGIRQPADRRVNQAWIQMPPDAPPSRDSGSKQSHAETYQLARIFAGPNDWMVWAIDTRQNVYVRESIDDAKPLGSQWTVVPGVRAETMCVSSQFVYVLSPNHECFIRHGITSSCPDGEYWKQIPGTFSTISAAAGESLWALDTCGQLQRRHVFSIERQNVRGGATAKSNVSVDDDWEVVAVQ